MADVGPLLAKCQFAPCLMEDRELEVVTRMLEFMFSAKRFGFALVTFAMAMVNATCAFGDQAVSCTISPLDLDNTVCQTITLNSEETGSFTVGINTPSGYTLVGVVDGAPTGGNPDFLWINTGPQTYSVVNTAWTAGSTTVRVTATWKKTISEGGSGGGGEGAIVRWAQDTAEAREGALIVETEPTVLPISQISVAQAFRSDESGRYAVNASWTVDEPAFIVGADIGSSVSVQSDEAGTFGVHATTVSPPPHSGSAIVTFVAVTSIKADHERVFVGGEISYTVTTDPAGNESLVSIAPADTSTPGVKQVVATCGSSSANCTVTVIQVDLFDISEEVFFRSTSSTLLFTFTPEEYAEGLTVSLEGFDSEHWIASYDSTAKKIDFANLIEATEPVAWLDKQLLSVSATIDDVAGDWKVSKRLNLKKNMEGLKDLLIDTLIDQGSEYAEELGDYAADQAKEQMKLISAEDSNGIVRKFNELRIDQVCDHIKYKINGALPDFLSTTLPGDIPSKDLHDQVTDESWTFEWDSKLTITVSGGDISVDSGGNPHLNAGDWIRAVNDIGWSSKLFEPQKASITSTLTADGHIGHADVKARLFGGIVCNFDGYEDPETHEMTNGGQFTGMYVVVLFECWFQ